MELIENGLDSFRRAITMLIELDDTEDIESEYSLKEIILNYHHSLETLFKYLISEKNEYLIFENQTVIFENKAKRQNKVITPQTIAFMDALNRVLVLYDVDLNKQEYQAFKSLNAVRNSLTHHKIDLIANEIGNIISSTLKHVLAIFSKHLPDFKEFMKSNEISSNIKDLYFRNLSWEMGVLVDALGNLEDSKKKFDKIKKSNNLKKEADRLRTKFKDRISFSKCPLCEQEFFVSKGSIIKDANSVGIYGVCKLCGFNVSRDLEIIKYTSYSSFDGYESLINHKLSDSIHDYNYEYGTHPDKDVVKAITMNKDMVRKHYEELLRSYVDNIMELIVEQQIHDIEKGSQEDSKHFLIKCFNNIPPSARVNFISMKSKLWTLLEVYKSLLNEEYSKNENDYYLGTKLIKVKYDDILGFYSKWVNIKRNENEYHNIFQKHHDYNEILDDICIDTSSGKIWSNLAGESASEFGTIDNVHAYSGDLDYIEAVEVGKENILLKCIYAVDIETEAYFDHEFFANGTDEIYIKAEIFYDKENDTFTLGEYGLIGQVYN